MKLNAKEIATAVIEHESQFHKQWSELFKLELLAVSEHAAQECINGRGRQSEQKEKAGKAALKAIRAWLRKRNVSRESVGQFEVPRIKTNASAVAYEQEATKRSQFISCYGREPTDAELGTWEMPKLAMGTIPAVDSSEMRVKFKAMAAREETKGTRAPGGVIQRGGPMASAPSRGFLVRSAPGMQVTVKRIELVRPWRKAWNAFKARPFWTPEASDEFLEIFDIACKVERST